MNVEDFGERRRRRKREKQKEYQVVLVKRPASPCLNQAKKNSGTPQHHDESHLSFPSYPTCRVCHAHKYGLIEVHHPTYARA